MSLASSGGVESFGNIGFSISGRMRRRRSASARALLCRATALLSPIFATAARPTKTTRAEAEALEAFCRLACAVGLSHAEQDVLFGGVRELSRLILALETIGAALDVFVTPSATLAWFRDQTAGEPFNGSSPLQIMAVDGRLGVEMTLLHLRARQRCRRRA